MSIDAFLNPQSQKQSAEKEAKENQHLETDDEVINKEREVEQKTHEWQETHDKKTTQRALFTSTPVARLDGAAIRNSLYAEIPASGTIEFSIIPGQNITLAVTNPATGAPPRITLSGSYTLQGGVSGNILREVGTNNCFTVSDVELMHIRATQVRIGAVSTAPAPVVGPVVSPNGVTVMTRPASVAPGNPTPMPAGTLNLTPAPTAPVVPNAVAPTNPVLRQIIRTNPDAYPIRVTAAPEAFGPGNITITSEGGNITITGMIRGQPATYTLTVTEIRDLAPNISQNVELPATHRMFTFRTRPIAIRGQQITAANCRLVATDGNRFSAMFTRASDLHQVTVELSEAEAQTVLAARTSTITAEPSPNAPPPPPAPRTPAPPAVRTEPNAPVTGQTAAPNTAPRQGIIEPPARRLWPPSIRGIPASELGSIRILNIYAHAPQSFRTAVDTLLQANQGATVAAPALSPAARCAQVFANLDQLSGPQLTALTQLSEAELPGILRAIQTNPGSVRAALDAAGQGHEAAVLRIFQHPNVNPGVVKQVMEMIEKIKKSSPSQMGQGLAHMERQLATRAAGNAPAPAAAAQPNILQAPPRAQATAPGASAAPRLRSGQQLLNTPGSTATPGATPNLRLPSGGNGFITPISGPGEMSTSVPVQPGNAPNAATLGPRTIPGAAVNTSATSRIFGGIRSGAVGTGRVVLRAGGLALRGAGPGVVIYEGAQAERHADTIVNRMDQRNAMRDQLSKMFSSQWVSSGSEEVRWQYEERQGKKYYVQQIRPVGGDTIRNGMALDVTPLLDITDANLDAAIRDAIGCGARIVGGVLMLAGPFGMVLGGFVFLGASVWDQVNERFQNLDRQRLIHHIPTELLPMLEGATNMSTHALYESVRDATTVPRGPEDTQHTTAQETKNALLERVAFAGVARQVESVSPLPLAFIRSDFMELMYRQKGSVHAMYLEQSRAVTEEDIKAERAATPAMQDLPANEVRSVIALRRAALSFVRTTMLTEYVQAQHQLEWHASLQLPNQRTEQRQKQEEYRARQNNMVFTPAQVTALQNRRDLLGSQYFASGMTIADRGMQEDLGKVRTQARADVGREEAVSSRNLRAYDSGQSLQAGRETITPHPQAELFGERAETFLQTIGTRMVTRIVDGTRESRALNAPAGSNAPNWPGTEAFQIERGNFRMYIAMIGGQMMWSSRGNPAWVPIEQGRFEESVSGGGHMNTIAAVLRRVSNETQGRRARLDAVSYAIQPYEPLQRTVEQVGRDFLTLGSGIRVTAMEGGSSGQRDRDSASPSVPTASPLLPQLRTAPTQASPNGEPRVVRTEQDGVVRIAVTDHARVTRAVEYGLQGTVWMWRKTEGSDTQWRLPSDGRFDRQTDGDTGAVHNAIASHLNEINTNGQNAGGIDTMEIFWQGNSLKTMSMSQQLIVKSAQDGFMTGLSPAPAPAPAMNNTIFGAPLLMQPNTRPSFGGPSVESILKKIDEDDRKRGRTSDYDF